MEMSRRYFLSTPALVAGLGQLEMIRLNAADAPLARRFFMDLSCGRIGLKATFLESIDLAEGRRLAREHVRSFVREIFHIFRISVLTPTAFAPVRRS